MRYQDGLQSDIYTDPIIQFGNHHGTGDITQHTGIHGLHSTGTIITVTTTTGMTLTTDTTGAGMLQDMAGGQHSTTQDTVPTHLM